ncbi:hypothetical protein ACLSU7_07635 [Bdellovibrio sp. HCB185ZH]|uniref:hypothetical protein n=1 Tax=Bdellovibrio sp. HCB185ZH TaxID=3394235 RepID=UPI0039A556C6
MKTAKWISLFLLLFVSSHGWAVQYRSSTYSEKLAVKKNPLKGLSLVVPGFVVHGVKPSEAASNSMPRKMDGNGSTVITPGFGLEYVDQDGFLLLGAVVKDCYDGLAGTLQAGEMFQISDRTQWGLTFGVYARQTPPRDIDGYRMKFLTSVNGHSVDIIPTPFLHFSTALYKSRDFRIDFKVMSNVVLNEFGFAFPF